MKLADVRRFALSLPDTTEEPHHQYTSFRVQGRIFVTAPPAATHVHVFADETSREQALALYPAFVEKLFWGAKVSGVRIDLAKAQPTVVKSLIRGAWASKAAAKPSGKARKRP